MKYKGLHLIFIFALTFSLKAQDNGARMTPKEIQLLVDSLSVALTRWYIYPEKAELMAMTIKSKCQSGGYNKLLSRAALADLMTSDVRKAHYDGHMRIAYAPETEKMLLTVLSDSMQIKEDKMEIGYEQANNFYFVKTEILQGDIGYIRWDEFAEYTKEAQNTYEAAFRFVSNSKALIIDMRYCRGGWPPTVNAMLNYFLDERLPLNHIIDHKGDTVKYFSDPKATSFKLNMPIYILTSKRTFSGAEDFTYALKVSNRAIIVGDTTGGGAHPTETVPLGQGFVMRIPNARSYNEITRSNWEGTGVYPDAPVISEIALEKARLLIFKDFFNKAIDDKEKMEAAGQVTAAENQLVLAKSGSISLSYEYLLKFCGDYRPLPGQDIIPMSIIMKGCDLFRHIPYPPDWKLIPISNTRLVYDNDDKTRYMDFIFDKEGNPTGVTLYYTDRKFVFEKVR
jgi:hypothetical protein